MVGSNVTAAAERRVLAAMLQSHVAIADLIPSLRSSYLSERHALIFDAIVDIYGQGGSVSLPTVLDYLQQRGALDAAGGSAYLTDVAHTPLNGEPVGDVGRLLLEQGLAKSLISLGARIASLGEEALLDRPNRLGVLSQLQAAEQQLFRLISEIDDEQPLAVSELLSGVLDEIEASGNFPSQGGWLEYGFSELDYVTGGLHKSDLVIVSGDANVGKSTLVRQIATEASVQSNVATMLLTSQYDRNDLVLRILSATSGVETWRLYRGELRDDDWNKLAGVMRNVSGAPLFVQSFVGELDFVQFSSLVRRFSRVHDLGLVVIDRMHSSSNSSNVQAAREAERLKGLAVQCDLPIVVVCDPPSEQAIDSWPNSDETWGRLTRAADVLLDVWRLEHENQVEYQCRILKNRHGPTTAFSLRADFNRGRFL